MRPKIAVLGDILLDRYDYVENRENPESSAPCHRVKNTKFLPGGAGNVAANLAKLGAEVTLFGIIGNDDHGKQLLAEITKLGVNQKILIEDTIKTIVKQRILSAHDGRYHGRLDFGDHTSEINAIKSLAPQIVQRLFPLLANGFDACIISDYNKGFITQEIVSIIKSFHIPIYVDPKQDKFLYKDVELIKPNRKEISMMSSIPDDKEKATSLAKELNTNILLTLGEKGMFLAEKTGETFYLPANKTEVLDVTGCGDTTIATLVFYRTLGKSLRESIILANKAAGINVQHIGCYQISREEIEGKNPFIISISGPPGAGSTTVAKILAEKLNLDYFSPGRLYKDIARGTFEQQNYAAEFKKICAEKQVMLSQLTEKNDSHGTLNFWQTSLGKDPKFHEAIDDLQVILSQKGNVIFDGKLSIFMIKNANPKIWLNCSLEERAKRAAQRDNISHEEAISIVRKRQETEREEWKKIYGQDSWDQEKEADIVIDTTNISPEEIAEQIISQITKL